MATKKKTKVAGVSDFFFGFSDFVYGPSMPFAWRIIGQRHKKPWSHVHQCTRVRVRTSQIKQ